MPSSTLLDQLLNPAVLPRVAAHLAGDPIPLTYASNTDELDFGLRFEHLVDAVRKSIRNGFDPLGTAYCRIHGPLARRPHGQTFTPFKLIEGMFDWAARQSTEVERIVDPGAGSGRYVLYGLRKYPKAKAVAVEKSPDLAVLLRANARVLGVASRLTTIVADYRQVTLPEINGRTLFIGNPPYVRHHDIETSWKQWYANALRKLGHSASQLAGLHLHFFLKTLELARPGDLGCFVTASEWLDVKYGQALRDLLTNGLGGQAVYLVSPTIPVFEDALVSAAITCFSPHAGQSAIDFRMIDAEINLDKLTGGHQIERQQARAEPKWSVLVRNVRHDRPSGHIQLGEIFKVQRGQVTGLNKVWVHRPDSPSIPRQFLFPSITDARDIVDAKDAVIDSTARLRAVVDLPASLDNLAQDDLRDVHAFLAWAKAYGADKSYIAEHRSPWWRVRLKEPAPIVVTYMGRRPPVFARNTAGARLINVAHGLYPRDESHVGENYLRALVHWLNRNVLQDAGRAYAGGLTKFEPSEVMRLYIPQSSELPSLPHASA